MDASARKTYDLKIGRVLEALAKNGMKACFAETKEDALKLVEELLNDGDTISCGGSVTLSESGVLALMDSGKYNFLDRAKVNDPAEVYAKLHSCDAFLTSANAVTEDGELYNVDGNANRVSAIAHGPKRVIVIAGKNKIVRDLEAAVYRAKTVAAPANGMRLNKGTPCAKTGMCIAKDGKMTDGCDSPDRMCCHYLVTGKQRVERIYVIIVGEELGY